VLHRRARVREIRKRTERDRAERDHRDAGAQGLKKGRRHGLPEVLRCCVDQLAGYGGFLLGGNYIWLGVATLPIMAVLDSILPIDLAKRRMSSRAIANIPVWLCTLLDPGCI